MGTGIQSGLIPSAASLGGLIKQYAVPTTGQTVTAASNTNRLLINPAGTLLALTVVFPSPASDNQLFQFTSTQILTGLTMTSGSDTVKGALTAVAAVNGFASWVYDLPTTTWYRIG